MDISADIRDDAPLTKRERQIFGLMAEGLSRKQIAGRLCRSLRTVDRHIDHILDKIEAANATHAVSVGVASGWIKLMIRKALCIALLTSMTHVNDDVLRARTRLRLRTRETACANTMI